MAKFPKHIFLIAVFLLNVQPGVKKCFADNNNNYNLNLQLFSTTYCGLKTVFLSPLYFSRSDWNKAGIIALGTGVLYTQDTAIRDYFQQKRTADSDSGSFFFSHFGDGTFTVPILAAFYVYGAICNKSKYKRIGILGVESMMVTGIITGGIKLVLRRPLPDSGYSYDTWNSEWSSFDGLAFPSGHTSSAFAFAAIIASEFSDIKLVPVLAYTVASLTAISRLNDNVHWASDILPGAALGYFTAKKIEALSKGRESSNLTFLPLVSGDSISLFCSFGF